MKRRVFAGATWCVVCLVLACAGGCAFSGRYVLLAHDEPITPPQTQDLTLTGLKLYVGPFTYAYSEARETYFDGAQGASEDNMPPLDGYKYIELTEAQANRWTEKQQKLAKGYEQRAEDIIGGVRNGWGSTTSSVYALNPPGQWLQQSIRAEAAAMGAVIVDAPAQADIAVEGEILWLYADMRVGAWSVDYKVQFVTRMNVKPAGREARVRTCSVDGGAFASWGTDYEYYRAIRDAHHKFLIRLMTELRNIRAEQGQ